MMNEKQLEAALRLAREALESCTPGDYSTGHVISPSYDEAGVEAAFAAIDKALAEQPAQPDCPKCGNNRQVWDNQITGKKTCHRTGCHQEIKQPAQQQTDERIDALRTLDYCHGLKAGWNFCAADDDAGFERAMAGTSEAVRILKTQPAQQQEPVVWMYQNKSTHEVSFQKHMRSFVDHGAWYEVPLYSEPLANQEKTSGSPKPAKPEALRLAELFEVAANAAPEGDEGWLKTAAELRRMHDLLGKANALCRIRAEEIERLKAQPAPVAEPHKQQEPDYSICPTCGGMASDPIVPPANRFANRPWVGLTDKEIDALYEAHHNQYGECETPGFGYERAIEAKLRELNEHREKNA